MRGINLSLLTMEWSRLLALCVPLVALPSCDCGSQPTIHDGPGTTSHSVRWQIDTIGIFQSSLADVWGSSDNDVWAVSRITTNTSGFRPNAVHFDGFNWQLVQIEEGYDISGIYGFDRSTVFAGGTNGRVYSWNGTNWRQEICLGIGDGCDSLIEGQQLNAIWGSSLTDIFAVGVLGVIVHCDAQAWTRMYSGTTLHFTDVWGSSSDNVYAVGMDLFSGQWLVLHYDGSTCKPDSVDPVQLNRPGGI